jgi:hypothetical protein
MMTQKFLDKSVKDVMRIIEFHYQILHELSLIQEKDPGLYEAEYNAIMNNLNSDIRFQVSRISMEKQLYAQKK